VALAQTTLGKMKKVTIIYLLFLLLWTSCRKDQDVFVVEETTLAPFKVGVVGGLVTDVHGNPLSNTSVNLKTKDADYQITTDSKGVFYFRHLDLPEERCYIATAPEGFFPGFRAFIPRRGIAEFVRINLIPLDATNAFEAANGIDMELPDGSQISIAPDAFLDQAGDAYNGTVNLSHTVIASNDSKMNLLMPGDLSARNAEGLWQSLATYGMMALHASDDVGALLQIASPDKVTLRLPIIASQLNTAPATIPLWSFDSENGYWILAGTAQKQSDYYESNLADFTFLNWAVPYPMIKLTTQLQLFALSTPYTNAAVEVAVVGSGICAYGLTDSEGNLETGVAANQVLALRVYSHCGEIIYETEIGPYSSDAKTAAVSLAANSSEIITCKGKLIDCDEAAITQGYVAIDLATNKHILFTGTDGTFEAHLHDCNSDQLIISGTNIINGKDSEEQLLPTGPVVDVGIMTICD
jgi:hypothetical protein